MDAATKRRATTAMKTAQDQHVLTVITPVSAGLSAAEFAWQVLHTRAESRQNR